MLTSGDSVNNNTLSRRQQLRLSAMSAVGVALVACAPSQRQRLQVARAVPAADETVTLTIFDFGGDADKRIYAGAHARFKEAHPNVTIVDNFTPVSTWGEESNKTVTQVAGGEAPTLSTLRSKAHVCWSARIC